MTVRAVFFDNDGVLVDTEPYYFEANRKVLEAYHFPPLTLTEYIRLSLDVGKSPLEVLHQSSRFSDIELARIKAERDTYYECLLNSPPKVFPGISDLLLFLKNKVKLGIVTTSLKNHFQIAHQHTHLRSYFDFEITREDVIWPKPDPEPYLKALEKAGVLPEQGIVVEDSFRGLKSAVLAGIPCVIIPTPYTLGQNFESAIAVFNHAGELQAYLKDRLR